MKSISVFPLLVFAISLILISVLFHYPLASGLPFVNGLQIATSGSHVYAVWQKHSDAPLVKRDVYFRTSSDNGVTFANTLRLNDDDQSKDNPWGNTGISERVPFVAASENHVYVMWDELSTDVSTTKWYFVVSDDYGVHFRRPILLSGGDSTASTDMAASGNNVYTFWVNGTIETNVTNYKVMMQTSNDNGRTFGESIIIPDYDKNRYILFPQLTSSGDGVVAAWYAPSLREGSKSDVYITRIDGQNMSSITILDNSTANYKLDKLVASGNNVYVLVQNIIDVKDPNGSTIHKTDEYLIKSTDGGGSFGKPIDITGNYDGYRNIDSADLVASGNNVYAMWVEDDGIGKDEIYKLYTIASSDRANSFGTKILISDHAVANNMVANGNSVYLPYEVSSPEVRSQVFLATSLDGEKSFEKKSLSNATAFAEESHAFMLGNGIVNIAWLNSVGDSDTIFYLADINGTKTMNLLGSLPKYYQSLWIGNDVPIMPTTVVKKPILNVTPVNKTKQETPVANTTVSIHGLGTVMTKIITDSPLKQVKSGVAVKDVKCKEGLQFMIKNENDQPACVKPETIGKLIERGWGFILSALPISPGLSTLH